MDSNLQRCVNLLKENDERVRVAAELALSTVCHNILSHPDRKKFRELRLDDSVVLDKLLSASGAMECLFEIGFVEAVDSLYLPQGASLDKLQALAQIISIKPGEQSKINPENLNGLCATITPEEKHFFTRIIQLFHRVMRYEDPVLQEKARKLIPLVDLELATMSKIRNLQKKIKLNQVDEGKSNARKKCMDVDISVKDLFLLELLDWYKCKFFTWVDSPTCPVCSSECAYESVASSSDPRLSRIELHRCSKCEALVKFPRYSDPDPLLTLRRGRCGEWANVFTLFCRSLGYDVRLVCDETDHVWTEIWSFNENRWIHVDPCENVMDRPLMYEKGWRKKLSYIIAYSKDEIQDVTWRYTQDQVSVMQRRKLCTEVNLLQLIETLNKQRQSTADYSSLRREYVNKRKLLELVELLYIPSDKNNDKDEKEYGGRSTGSYAWKLARGEIAEEPTRRYSWDISKYGRTFHLRYSIIRDRYRIINDGDAELLEKSGWKEGVQLIEGGMFRKVENDWKVVYLARSPGKPSGKIEWNFEVNNPKLCVYTLKIAVSLKVYHGADVSWRIRVAFDGNQTGSRDLELSTRNDSNYFTSEVEGARKLTLSANVSGGEGVNAWQHAQLFRQSLEGKDESMIIDIVLKEF